jgi:hypothetical protein
VSDDATRVDPAGTGAGWTTVLDLAQLRIELRRGSGQPVSQPWFQVRLHAAGAPFRGTIESAWFGDDLRALRTAVAGIAVADDDVSFVVGGNRAAELRLTGGPSGDVHWLTAWMTPSGDDPYPTLEMLLYEAPEKLVSRLGELDALLAELR